MQNSTNSIPQNVLYLSIIIDNSASMKGPKIDKLKQALSIFHHQTTNVSNHPIRYSVTVSRGFGIHEVKTFDDAQLHTTQVNAMGFPNINEMITSAIQSIEKGIKQVPSLYKPWLVLLLDGNNFTSIDSSLQLLTDAYKQNKLNYFPFILSDQDIDLSLNDLIKLKRPMVVTDQKYDMLFDWLFNTVKSRVETPPSETFNLKADGFNGWVRR